MSIEKVTCFTIACDGCRLVFDEDTDGHSVHFDSPDAALAYITEEAGWVVTTNGHIQCPRCWATLVCDQHGHAYSPWHPCACHGRYADHALFGCGLFRYCQRPGCDHFGLATLAALPTIDEPTHPGR